MRSELPSGSRSKTTSGVHLWLVLWKATRTLESLAQRNVEELGMCLSDFGVLEALLHKGPLPVNALGAKVLLTSGSITVAIDRLERRKLVKRQNDPNDRRARVVHLTARGQKIIRAMFADHEQAMERAVSVLTAQERAALVDLLRKLGHGVEHQQSEPDARAVAASAVRQSKRRRQ